MSMTITLPGGEIQLSGNKILVVCTSDTVGVTVHHLLCKVESTDGAIPGGPFIDDKPIKATSATFDIQGLVDTRFDYDFQTDSTDKLIAHDLLAANVTITVGESYYDANGVFTETWGGSVDLTVLKGMLSKYEYAWLLANNSSFYTEYIEKGRFLTHFPLNGKILAGSKPKLWFIPPAAEDYTITIDVAYNGVGPNEVSHIATLGINSLYEVNCNPADWGLPYTRVADGAKITWIGVSVTGASFSASHAFTVDNDYYENVEHFYFVNSLSGIDLISCTGQLDEDDNTEGEVYTMPDSYSPKIGDETIVSERKSETLRYKINTGFMDEAKRRWAKQFLCSQRAWWATDRFRSDAPYIFEHPAVEGNHISIRVLPGATKISSTNEDILGIDLEFELTYR